MPKKTEISDEQLDEWHKAGQNCRIEWTGEFKPKEAFWIPDVIDLLRKERAWSKVAREALEFSSGDRFDAATDGEDMRPTPIAVLALDALKKREEIFGKEE